MQIPNAINFLDIARAVGSNPLHSCPSIVEKFLIGEFSRSRGIFNYNPAITCLPGLYQGSLTPNEAERYCLTNGVELGRIHNAEAVKIVAEHAYRLHCSVYPIPNTAIPIGRLSTGLTVFMLVKAPLVRVTEKEAFVVVPNFRAGHRPILQEIDTAASLALAAFARDDFEQADFEYVDCGRGKGGHRALEVHFGRDRRVFTLDEVDEILSIFVQGFELAMRAGVAPRASRLQGFRVADPDAPRML
jgi:hypothetical protein